jgi:hypothetical protein
VSPAQPYETTGDEEPELRGELVAMRFQLGALEERDKQRDADALEMARVVEGVNRTTHLVGQATVAIGQLLLAETHDAALADLIDRLERRVDGGPPHGGQ